MVLISGLRPSLGLLGMESDPKVFCLPLAGSTVLTEVGSDDKLICPPNADDAPGCCVSEYLTSQDLSNKSRFGRAYYWSL